ncbi:MAG: ABC transporter substrate-binding protein [Mesorhizobium sp.]|nr:ABC transporter substrate-binding protein [Mesorhizobium sp.]MCO5163798.1 ABC transporter substrate-binding protein [Mesorhizobium sp.]
MTYFLRTTRARRAAMWAATVALTLAALAAPTPKARSAEDAASVASAQRIVAIGGSVTEIVYALGEEKRLAGRDSTSVYPHAALALPDIGYMRAISPEGVLGIAPDAILTIEGSGPPEAIEVLRKASVPFATVPEGFDEPGILEKIRAVGAALGVPDKAEALVAEVKADIDAAIAATAGISARRRVLFILSMQGGKALAAGTGTAAEGIIRMAGGINAVGEFAGYKPLTDEAIVTAKPDLILMMEHQGNHAAANSDLKAHPALSQTPAVRNDAILRMDGAYLLGFGPRTASAARDLAKALYGDGVVN